VVLTLYTVREGWWVEAQIRQMFGTIKSVSQNCWLVPFSLTSIKEKFALINKGLNITKNPEACTTGQLN